MFNMLNINIILIRCVIFSWNAEEYLETRMWANAQRHDHPAEYRWRPLFNAAKFGWRPLPEWGAVTLPRRETRWNLLGCPKLTNRSQPLVGRSWPYCEDMWRTCCCLTSFFSDCRMSIRALVAKIQPEKFVWWCHDCEFFNHFLRPVFLSKPRAAHFRPAF